MIIIRICARWTGGCPWPARDTREGLESARGGLADRLPMARYYARDGRLRRALTGSNGYRCWQAPWERRSGAGAMGGRVRGRVLRVSSRHAGERARCERASGHKKTRREAGFGSGSVQVRFGLSRRVIRVYQWPELVQWLCPQGFAGLVNAPKKREIQKK